MDSTVLVLIMIALTGSVGLSLGALLMLVLKDRQTRVLQVASQPPVVHSSVV